MWSHAPPRGLLLQEIVEVYMLLKSLFWGLKNAENEKNLAGEGKEIPAPPPPSYETPITESGEAARQGSY